MEQTTHATETGDSPAGGGDLFATTHWSVVLAAGQTESPDSLSALAQLCEAYWYPLYAFARRQGYSPEDAEDVTQGFFARLLRRNYFAELSQSKGKFRAFLIAAFKHFLCDEGDRARALKRGGGQTVLSLDAQEAEHRYQLEPVNTLTPDKLYEQKWAYALMEKARFRLREEYGSKGQGELYAALKGLDGREAGDQTYAEMAVQLGMTLSAIKAAARRMRERYGKLLRLEIAQTVATPAEIDEEIRHLLAIISE
jgi:DNA-directed RNA polymerase specialized sigma24 family protein